MDLSVDSLDESSPVDALELFREKWQNELVITTSGNVQESAKESAINENGLSADDKEVMCHLIICHLSIVKCINIVFIF